MTYRSTLLHFRLMEQRLFQHVVTIDQARSKSGMQVHHPARYLTYPKPERSHACGSFPGAQGGEAGRAQQLGDVCGLLA